MDSSGLYDFLRGPGFVIAALVFAAGSIFRIFQFIQMTRSIRINIPQAYIKDSQPEDKTILIRGNCFRKLLTSFKLKIRNTIFVSNPVMGVVSLIFHSLLFITPFFLPAHNVLADLSLSVGLFTLPEPLMDKFTIALIIIGGFFLARRIFIPRVRALSTIRDYFILLLVLAPFLSAFFAYHHLFNYRAAVTAHMLIGEIAIALVPFTSLVHMPFLVFSRFFVAGEYSWRTGIRGL